ncbi:uncharacterized protein LOC113049926 [Carassius auratus]|uniref:Uncharacterized protein LOC113049926 n=1 Tax=Carassius auratus TaxID=7957 RepID=A0A6P6K7T9_CARAU|nr:uncharacterized protein LOC113049926 [Carassius auratus]
MGQNQGKEGEPGQDNSSEGPEEKGPSPDPGGAKEEGNLTIETHGVGTDEENGGGLDGGPGRESPSPTPVHALDSHDKVCAPTEGGDGEKEGGRKSNEEGRAGPLASQQLNGITQSDSEPDHERKDLKSTLEDRLENFRCDLPAKDKAENGYRGENKSKKCASHVKNKMESDCRDDDKLKSQEKDRKLDFEATCDITGPTLEILEGKDVSKPRGGNANTNVHFTVLDQALVITEDIKLKTSMTESQNKRTINKPTTSNLVMNSQAETSKDITEAIEHSNEEIQRELPEKNAETQGENVTGRQPTEDVIKTRFTSSALAGADLPSKAVSLSPEDLSALEVASKSYRQISAGEFTQDEFQKERQFNVSDSESPWTKEHSLGRSPAGGHKNKDGMRESEEREYLESASKGPYHSYAKKTKIKDHSLCGTETEEGCFVTSNIAIVGTRGENKPWLQRYEDEKCIAFSEDITDSNPPCKSDVQVMQENEKEDFPLSAKAKVHTEKSLEWFLAEEVIKPLPETVKDTTYEMDPECSSSVSALIDVEEQQRIVGNANSADMTSSEKDKVGKSTISLCKETSATGSISELIAGPETTSVRIDDRPSVDKKTEVTLSASSQLQETFFLKVLTNADVSGQVRDSCAAGAALTDNTSAAKDLQHSSSVCNLISMQANEKQEQNKLSTNTNCYMLEEKHSSQLDRKHATESSPTTIMEAPQGAQKRHVSDMIKETIELQKKMKEWSKPAEARVDLTLDPTQSVKVSQMKAAFDSPKKSPDKALERKPSVRKGRNISEKDAIHVTPLGWSRSP